MNRTPSTAGRLAVPGRAKVPGDGSRRLASTRTWRDADAAFAAAVEQHRAGRLPQAEALVWRGAADSISAGHVKAAHSIWAPCWLQLKAVEKALPLLAFAAQADPDGPQSWITYAHALIASGAFAAAEALLATHADQAWQGDPRARAADPPAPGVGDGVDRSRRTRIRADAVRAGAGARARRRRRSRRPGVPAAQAWRGPSSAEASLAQALALSPHHIAALVNRSAALKALGRSAEAEAAYRQVLALKPDDVAATRSLAILLAELGQADEAAATYARAVELDGGAYETLEGFGVTLWGLGRYDAALAALDSAVARRPGRRPAGDFPTSAPAPADGRLRGWLARL